jgi:hypothetical protein
MNDLTIIYYTANREDDVFEAKIRAKLLENSGGLPIISVSQKPINLGKNICVGDVGYNDDNLYRQILIGCEAAKTKYVISAESDFLYPPDYFTFRPPTNEVYRYDNVWILKYWHNEFFKKCWSEGAQIMSRELYIKILNRGLIGMPMWNPAIGGHGMVGRRREYMFPYLSWKYYSGQPAVSVKTISGLRKQVGTIPGHEAPPELPYWGSGANLKQYLNL